MNTSLPADKSLHAIRLTDPSVSSRLCTALSLLLWFTRSRIGTNENNDELFNIDTALEKTTAKLFKNRLCSCKDCGNSAFTIVEPTFRLRLRGSD